MSWAKLIDAGIGAWARKAAASLGLGLVSYVGFLAIKSQIDQAVANMWGGMVGEVYQVVALAGFVDAVGVWLGALTTAVSLVSFKRLGAIQA